MQEQSPQCHNSNTAQTIILFIVVFVLLILILAIGIALIKCQKAVKTLTQFTKEKIALLETAILPKPIIKNMKETKQINEMDQPSENNKKGQVKKEEAKREEPRKEETKKKVSFDPAPLVLDSDRRSHQTTPEPKKQATAEQPKKHEENKSAEAQRETEDKGRSYAEDDGLL